MWPMSSRFAQLPVAAPPPVGAACSWRSRSRPVCRAAVGPARRRSPGKRRPSTSPICRVATRPTPARWRPPRPSASRTISPALESRFSSGARSPCGLEAFAGPSFDPSTTPTNTTVNGDTASVAFPGDTLPGVGDTLRLDHVHGRWRINVAGAFRLDQTPQAATQSEELLFSQACLEAWNTAVSDGQVTVPATIETPATAAWAYLIGTGSGVPCTTMSIDDPSTGYCETYIQNQGDASWLQTPCVNPPIAGKVGRDVWLSAGGTATPAHPGIARRGCACPRGHERRLHYGHAPAGARRSTWEASRRCPAGFQLWRHHLAGIGQPCGGHLPVRLHHGRPPAGPHGTGQVRDSMTGRRSVSAQT